MLTATLSCVQRYESGVRDAPTRSPPHISCGAAQRELLDNGRRHVRFCSGVRCARLFAQRSPDRRWEAAHGKCPPTRFTRMKLHPRPLAAASWLLLESRDRPASHIVVEKPADHQQSSPTTTIHTYLHTYSHTESHTDSKSILFTHLFTLIHTSAHFFSLVLFFYICLSLVRKHVSHMFSSVVLKERREKQTLIRNTIRNSNQTEKRATHDTKRNDFPVSVGRPMSAYKRTHSPLTSDIYIYIYEKWKERD